MTPARVEAAIFQGLERAGAGRSLSPEEVARAVDEPDWRQALPQVRTAAVALAREGRLIITRHGKPVDPDGFKGVYRLRLPAECGPEAGE